MSSFVDNVRKSSGQHVYENMSDDWYDQMIEQYKGTPYYDLLYNNPHLVRNAAPFAPSAGDEFAESWGDYSAGNRYYADLHNQAIGFLSDQLKNMRQENYDSALGQTQQMRAAGLNPDLQQVSAGSSAENDQPFTPTQMPEAVHPQDIAKNVADLGISLVSQVMSMAQGLQGLQAGAGQIIAQDISNHSGAMDLLFKEMIDTMPASELKDPEHIDSEVFLRQLTDIANDTSYSSHTRRVLKRYVSSLQGDSGTAKLQQAKLQLAEKYQQSRKNTAGIIGDPLYDEDFADWVANLSKYFNEYVFKAEKASFKRSVAEDNYNTSYYNNRNPELAAGAGNAADTASTTQSENVQMIEDLWNSIYKFLKNDDHWYSKLALALLPAVRAFSMGQLSIPVKMDFSTKNSSSTNNIERSYHINN